MNIKPSRNGPVCIKETFINLLYVIKVMLIVQAIIEISEHANRIISIVKAKCGLKNKSEAITLMAEQDEEEILELNLRPECRENGEKTERTHCQDQRF